MAITVKVNEPWSLHPEELKLPVDSEDRIFYQPDHFPVSGQTVLDDIGVDRKTVCFVRLDGKFKSVLTRDFVQREFDDESLIEIFPFTIAG